MKDLYTIGVKHGVRKGFWVGLFFGFIGAMGIALITVAIAVR